MKLSSEQQAMADGKYGKGKAMAMQIQIAIGEGFEADRMIPVSRAHVSLSAQEADVWFAEKMLNAGASCAVSPTVNPGYSLEYFTDKRLLDARAIENMEKTERVYKALGAVLTYSCTPYLFENIPRYREVAAFSETSATIYVNSVLGAMTNRESAASAMCAAITGFVPEYGMLLEEKRFADVVVEVEASVKADFDFSLLGLMGKKIGKGIPVFLGLPREISTEALINLGTQLNVSGMFERYLITQVTPDASDLKEALGGKEPVRRVVITDSDLQEALEGLSPKAQEKIEYVILGCPHYTWQQILRAERLTAGKRAAVPVWILTSAAVKNLAARMGIEEELKERGIELVADTCVDEACCFKHLAGKQGATDSPKAAYYMASFGVEMTVRDAKTCLLWAQGGESC